MAAKVSATPPDNKYERVIVAAREARRLNEWDAQRIERPYRRICEEAVQRVDGGQVKFSYDPAPPMMPAPSIQNPLLPSAPPIAEIEEEEELP